MVKGNFLGASIVAIIYTVFILMNPGAMKSKTAFVVAWPSPRISYTNLVYLDH